VLIGLVAGDVALVRALQRRRPPAAGGEDENKDEREPKEKP
jgi:hypothetical protein